MNLICPRDDKWSSVTGKHEGKVEETGGDGAVEALVLMPRKQQWMFIVCYNHHDTFVPFMYELRANIRV